MKQKGTCNTGSLYQKVKGGVWYMRFTEYAPDGQRKRVVFSTGTADKAEAEDALAEKVREYGFATSAEKHVDALLKVQRNIDNERLRIDKERAEAEAKRQAEAEAAAAIERDRRAITFAEAFAIFRVSKKRPDSGDVTLSHYESQYNRFVRWTAAHHPAVVKMRDFTPSMAEAFIDEIEKTQSRNTRNKYLIFLRMFWRVMRWEADAQLTIDPWDGIRTLTQTPDTVVHRELTVEQLTAIAEVINSGKLLPIVREKGNAKAKAGNIRDAFMFKGVDIRAEMRLLFAIGIYTGQRFGDCATLTWADVDLVRGIVTVTPRKTKRKYKRVAIIPIHRAFAAILAEIPKSRRRGLILPTVSEMYEGSSATLSRTVQAIMTAAGIETTADAPEAGTKARTVVGFHSLRHTFSSFMLNAGVSPALVDSMLTHSKESMTMRYYHEHVDALLRAVSHLPTLAQYASRVEAVENAVGRERPSACAVLPSGTADAPRGILAAIRDELDGATDDELKAAAAIIKKEITKRGRAAR